MANVSTLFTTYRKFWSQIAPMCGQIRYVLRLFLRDKLDKRLWSPFSSHLWSTPKIEVNSFFWTRLGWSLYIDIILVLISPHPLFRLTKALKSFTQEPTSYLFKLHVKWCHIGVTLPDNFPQKTIVYYWVSLMTWVNHSVIDH